MKTVPPIHTFRSRKEWEAEIWKQLVNGLVQITSIKGMERSLALILTAYEKKQMVKRVVAISLLKQGKTYREIGKILWLSPSTISALKKSMRTSEEYVTHYMRHKKHEKPPKRLTKAEWEQLRFTIALEALFIIPQTSLRRPYRFLPYSKNRKKW